MKEDVSAFKARVQAYQMKILVIQVFIMMIGGCVFGLGVATRPILRITKPEFMFHVEWILDMMVATGLAQLATAGLDCFAACWKLLWPIYLGMGLTAMTVCLEFGSIGTSLKLLSQGDIMVNEDVVHPWYWVECQYRASCHDAMLAYIYHYILPQIILVAIAIFLQCLGIMYLGRLVRTIYEHKKVVLKYGEWHKEHPEKPNFTPSPPPTSRVKPFVPEPSLELEEVQKDNKDNKEIEEDDEIKEEDSIKEMVNPCYHTPSSILKTDHGYVAASGGSLDFDDSYMRNRNVREKAAHTPGSITFNETVQVHYFNTTEPASENN